MQGLHVFHDASRSSLAVHALQPGCHGDLSISTRKTPMIHAIASCSSGAILKIPVLLPCQYVVLKAHFERP